MARPSAEIPHFHNPWERMIQTAHDVRTLIGRNRLIQAATSAALAVGVLGVTTYFINQERGKAPATSTVPAAGAAGPQNNTPEQVVSIAAATPESSPAGSPPKPEEKVGTEPNPPDDNPDKGEVKAPPRETPASNLEPALKPLPEVINNETVKFVSPAPEIVENMIKDSIERGEPKIPLPKQVKEKNLEVKTLTTKMNKIPVLGFFAKEGQTIDMPALTGGVVIQAEGSLMEAGAGANIIKIKYDNGLIVTYAYASGSEWNVKVGERVSIGQRLFSTTYKQGSKGQEVFEKTLSYAKRASVIVNFGYEGQDPIGKGIDSVSTDKDGNVVTI